MTKSNWRSRAMRAMVWLAPGATLLGTSCGAEVRDAVIAAGADFVGASLGTILETLIPVDTLLQNAQDAGGQQT
jgi:hypothetical protein